MSKLLDALHDLLPASRSIRSKFYLTADVLIQALLEEGVKIVTTLIPEFETEDWDDEELEDIIFFNHRDFHKGLILIHAPACSRFDLEDFACEADNLRQFIRDYDIEMLFDGDVIFLAPESKTLTIFHHEGLFLHVHLHEDA